MENNKFFNFVWRFNGLVIFVGGILAIVLLIFVSYKVVKDATRERATNNIVNVAENADISENWYLGSITKVSGFPVLQIPLLSDQTFSREYYSKATNSTRNYLFINTHSSEKYWLFSHANYLIERRENIREGEYSTNKPVKATMYHLVKLDSNKDNLLTTSDNITIAFTKPDGTKYVEVLSDVENYVDSQLISDNELILIYQMKGTSYSTIINLDRFTMTNNEALPLVGSNK